MDTEKILTRIELREEWINGQRVTDQFRLGYSEALTFVRDWVIALDAAEEQDEHQEAKIEAYLDQVLCDGCED
jgi:hypothetical protein